MLPLPIADRRLAHLLRVGLSLVLMVAAGCGRVAAPGDDETIQCPIPLTIDGAFTGLGTVTECVEWQAQPSDEPWGSLYIHVDEKRDRLYLLADRHADKVAIPAAGFMPFLLQSDDGGGPLLVKVYGDARVAMMLGGKKVKRTAFAGVGFGPSPGNAAPHPIIELWLKWPRPGGI